VATKAKIAKWRKSLSSRFNSIVVVTDVVGLERTFDTLAFVASVLGNSP
jgi:hypothetical protein